MCSIAFGGCHFFGLQITFVNQPGEEKFVGLTDLFLCSKVVTLAKSRSFRERHGKILLEGRRLIADALAAGAIPQTLFFSAIEHLKELPLDKLKGVSLVKVKFEDLKTWSDVITSQGVIGKFIRNVGRQAIGPSELSNIHTGWQQLCRVSDKRIFPAQAGSAGN